MPDPSLDAFRAELRSLLARAAEAGADVRALARDAADLAAEVLGDAEGDAVADWHGMIGESTPMLALRTAIEKFARAKEPVLVRGESGTGKDLVARILHSLGPRSEKPFVAENCAAIPESLLESVLFGHKRGAFTGAVRDHRGHFVEAHGGTLFLDEIGDTSMAMQAKLLRALQEGEVRPVGGEKVRKVDVRVLAATNRDLEQLVREGSFREDLFYRLAVLELRVPPLRERDGDIALLARAILAEACERSGRSLVFNDDILARFEAYEWPGNIRQLQNEIRRLATLADGPEIGVADLSEEIR